MRNKEYRDAFVAEQIFSRVPLKIRALREQRNLSQKELGEKAGGMAQAWVSKLEDPNYGQLTISTLLRIASACDVGLQIDFVPFSQVLNSAVTLSEESFSVPSFEQDVEKFAEAVVADSSLPRPGPKAATLIGRMPDGSLEHPLPFAALPPAVQDFARSVRSQYFPLFDANPTGTLPANKLQPAPRGEASELGTKLVPEAA